MRDLIIAIDGHSSCGKSTLAKGLAETLNYVYITSGAMYRAVTWYFLQHEIPATNTTKIVKALDQINIKFLDKGQTVMLNQKDITGELHNMDVAKHVSDYAAIPEVRKKLVQKQQAIGASRKIVMDGRDIGTVVFPEAEVKIFMTADLEIRTARRYHELKERGIDISLEDVRRNLEQRDHIDSTRKDSPLLKAKDAVLLDTSNLSPEEQLQMALALAKVRMQKPG